MTELAIEFATRLELGCGLIRLGRRWGVGEKPPVPPEEGRAFVEGALSRGVRFFDTAPAYGRSELVLGDVLASLSAAARTRVFIATKVGEHWSDVTGQTTVDHSADAVARSLAQNLDRLGKIDLLQIHKATAEIISGPQLEEIDRQRREADIHYLGASVSSPEALAAAANCDSLDFIQFPCNAGSGVALRRDRRTPCVPLINRPLAMGAAVEGLDGDLRQRALVSACGTVRDHYGAGVVLTGTANLAHLDENLAALAHNGS